MINAIQRAGAIVALCCLALAAAHAQAVATSWPNKPLRIVVGFPAGSVTDTVARGLAEQLAKLERRVGHHDNSLAEIIDALRSLMERPATPKRGIGFTAKWNADKSPTATKATKK